jgi:hypothetical protein
MLQVAPPKSGLPDFGTIDIEIGNGRFRLALGNKLWSARLGLAREESSLTICRIKPIIYEHHPGHPTRLALSTDGSRTKHREAPMSFQANSWSAAENPCYAAQIPDFARTREFMSNVLIYHAIKPRGGPKKGKSGPILQIPC